MLIFFVIEIFNIKLIRPNKKIKEVISIHTHMSNEYENYLKQETRPVTLFQRDWSMSCFWVFYANNH